MSQAASRPAPPAPPGFAWGSGRYEGLLLADLLTTLPGIEHAFESRRGRLHGVLPAPLARLNQVHGAEVLRLPPAPDDLAAHRAPDPVARPPGDALISTRPGVTVAVAVADCQPILVADGRAGAVAAVHGGWRGLAAGILPATLQRLADLDCPPDRLVVAIGPAIGPCCFEVGPEVIEAFDAQGLGHAAEAPRPDGGPGNPHCDLAAVARAELEDAGVSSEEIAVADLCTRCHPDALWSYRADGDAAGRMLGGIALV